MKQALLCMLFIIAFFTLNAQAMRAPANTLVTTPKVSTREVFASPHTLRADTPRPSRTYYSNRSVFEFRQDEEKETAQESDFGEDYSEMPELEDVSPHLPRLFTPEQEDESLRPPRLIISERRSDTSDDDAVIDNEDMSGYDTGVDVDQCLLMQSLEESDLAELHARASHHHSSHATDHDSKARRTQAAESDPSLWVHV